MSDPAKVFIDLVRSKTYPCSPGWDPERDPTHGRIDRDIQWRVQDMNPSSPAQRVAMESTLQERRNRGEI